MNRPAMQTLHQYQFCPGYSAWARCPIVVLLSALTLRHCIDSRLAVSSFCRIKMADKDGTLVEDLADHMSKVSSLATLSVQSLTIPFLPPCFNHEEVLFLLRKQRKVLTIFKKCRRSCCYFRHLSTLMTRPTSCYCSQNWFAMAWPDLISSHCLTPILSRHDHPCCR